MPECADNKAFAAEEVRNALPEALARDWRAEVPDSLYRKIRKILGEKQSLLFDDERAEQLEALRGETAGHNLGSVFLDYAIQTAARGRSGDEALRETAAKALSDRAARGARQVEEHYRRESTQGRAVHVRDRIESGVTQSDMTSIVGRLIETDNSEGLRWPAKQTGLDAGVQM